MKTISKVDVIRKYVKLWRCPHSSLRLTKTSKTRPLKTDDPFRNFIKKIPKVKKKINRNKIKVNKTTHLLIMCERFYKSMISVRLPNVKWRIRAMCQNKTLSILSHWFHGFGGMQAAAEYQRHMNMSTIQRYGHFHKEFTTN